MTKQERYEHSLEILKQAGLLTPSKIKRTREAIRRIAELKIEAHNLPDTVEQYIEKCTVKS